jgi:hypothetical protein
MARRDMAWKRPSGNPWTQALAGAILLHVGHTPWHVWSVRNHSHTMVPTIAWVQGPPPVRTPKPWPAPTHELVCSSAVERAGDEHARGSRGWDGSLWSAECRPGREKGVQRLGGGRSSIQLSRPNYSYNEPATLSTAGGARGRARKQKPKARRRVGFRKMRVPRGAP